MRKTMRDLLATAAVLTASLVLLGACGDGETVANSGSGGPAKLRQEYARCQVETTWDKSYEIHCDGNFVSTTSEPLRNLSAVITLNDQSGNPVATVNDPITDDQQPVLPPGFTASWAAEFGACGGLVSCARVPANELTRIFSQSEDGDEWERFKVEFEENGSKINFEDWSR